MGGDADDACRLNSCTLGGYLVAECGKCSVSLRGFVRLLFRGLCGGCKELYLFTVRPSSTMVRKNRTRPILDNVSRVSLIYLPQIGITAAKRPEFSRLSRHRIVPVRLGKMASQRGHVVRRTVDTVRSQNLSQIGDQFKLLTFLGDAAVLEFAQMGDQRVARATAIFHNTRRKLSSVIRGYTENFIIVRS